MQKRGERHLISEKKKEELRNKYVGLRNTNHQGYSMTIIKYINYANVSVEFDDEYKMQKHCDIKRFKKGNVDNPMHPTLYNVGIVGEEYPTMVNGTFTKEYKTWLNMIKRCYDKYQNNRNRSKSYEICEVCKEWLYYPNFYKWLHSQENFNLWLYNDNWNIDKDILKKRNKIYSSENCCLTPRYVNAIFIKGEGNRGDFPIGVKQDKKNGKYIAQCHDLHKQVYLGEYNTPEEAFYVYKDFKENIIKSVAQKEFKNGNITKQCYYAMINYKVEITD